MPSFCPYVGLQPYREEDRDFFFGREREQRIIPANLHAARLTVLYAQRRWQEFHPASGAAAAPPRFAPHGGRVLRALAGSVGAGRAEDGLRCAGGRRLHRQRVAR
jgi:hypothetical protein